MQFMCMLHNDLFIKAILIHFMLYIFTEVVTDAIQVRSFLIFCLDMIYNKIVQG